MEREGHELYYYIQQCGTTSFDRIAEQTSGKCMLDGRASRFLMGCVMRHPTTGQQTMTNSGPIRWWSLPFGTRLALNELEGRRMMAPRYYLQHARTPFTTIATKYGTYDVCIRQGSEGFKPTCRAYLMTLDRLFEGKGTRMRELRTGDWRV